MKEECLVCKAPREYQNDDIERACEVTTRKEKTKTRCINGHYVCNECHMQGMDSLLGLCLNEASKNPVDILDKMMAMPFCHMHGPEHHVMVGMALLTAYKNSGGDIDLEKSLIEMNSRGRSVPGGACGFWGACGAGISTGMFVSIITGSTPLRTTTCVLHTKRTAKAVAASGVVSGPHCREIDCASFISLSVALVREHMGIEMEKADIVCSYSRQNNQCIGKRCPFSVSNRKKKKIAFICVHNSCRSQIAEAFGKKYLSDTYEYYSAGTEVKPQINQDAVRLMKQEYGIDMEKDQYSKLLEDIPEADIYVSMGCNVACPNIPGKQILNWGLDDPTGQEEAVFMDVIRRIEENVLEMRDGEGR